MMNPLRRPGWPVAGMLLALLAACSGIATPPPPPVQRVIEAPGKSTLQVSLADANARITLDRGQTLAVRLAVAGADHADWSVADLKPGVLKSLGSNFERAPRNLVVDEADGSVLWRFAPEAPGTVTLRFELRRPRKLEPPRQTVNFTVTVR